MPRRAEAGCDTRGNREAGVLSVRSGEGGDTEGASEMFVPRQDVPGSGSATRLVHAGTDPSPRCQVSDRREDALLSMSICSRWERITNPWCRVKRPVRGDAMLESLMPADSKSFPNR
jgi:hypothetical protein